MFRACSTVLLYIPWYFQTSQLIPESASIPPIPLDSSSGGPVRTGVSICCIPSCTVRAQRPRWVSTQPSIRRTRRTQATSQRPLLSTTLHTPPLSTHALSPPSLPNQLLLPNTRPLGLTPCLFQPPRQCLQPSWAKKHGFFNHGFPLPGIRLPPSHFHKTCSSPLSSHEATASFSSHGEFFFLKLLL